MSFYSKNDVGLIESLINEVKEAGTNSRCLFYQGVHLMEVSIKKKPTVFTVVDQGGLNSDKMLSSDQKMS